jgi:DNA-binding GntR family transcriptional regulator
MAERAPSRTFVTKSEFAREELRRLIQTEKLRPGERLLLRPLAEQLGLSVMPVRDALRMLEAEGLVVLDNHRSARVTEISGDVVLTTISLRMWLEILAVREATERHDRGTLAALSRALETSDAALRAADGAAYTQANRRLHEALEATAPEPIRRVVGEQWDRLWQTRRRTSLYVLSPERMAAAQEEHRELVVAVRERDVIAAGAAMERHRDETLRRWQAILPSHLGETTPPQLTATDASS